jgi:hypothetical protein
MTASFSREGKDEVNDVEISITTISDRITTEQTASFEIRVQNTAESIRVVSTGPRQLLPSRRTDPTGLYLIEADRNIERADSSSWVPAEDASLSEWVVAVQKNNLLQPGESLSEQYELWIDPETSAESFPTGTFSVPDNKIYIGKPEDTDSKMFDIREEKEVNTAPTITVE